MPKTNTLPLHTLSQNALDLSSALYALADLCHDGSRCDLYGLSVIIRHYADEAIAISNGIDDCTATAQKFSTAMAAVQILKDTATEDAFTEKEARHD